uniref:inositol-phosphate phosphatase n=1 Tax=Angiostrongylus cantonensis TaxID=6313 RepID=A0A0K0DCD2_ANGCA
MQIRLHARNTFTFLVAAAFFYLGYLIFFKSGDGFPEIDVDLSNIVSYAVLAVEIGGYAVRKIHEENALYISQKRLTDDAKAEPLTKADLVSNFLILDVLKRFPRLKIVTEEKDTSVSESDVAPYRADSYSMWLSAVEGILAKIPSRRLSLSDVQVYIDPLDATQEYTEGLTDYVTVMACVVVKDEPIFGAIFRPFSNETMVGVKGWGVMKSSRGMTIPVNRKDTAKKVVVSRSHAGDVEKLVRRSFGEAYEVESVGGSGYKVLRLLNGTAELYIHQTAIKKWDTCAGDAILRSFGGAMIDLDGVPLRYVMLMLKRGLIASVRTPYMYVKKIVQNEKP